MKDSCTPGLEKNRRITVAGSRVIHHLGKDLGVYATPAMVADIEKLCHDLLQPHLDAGEGSVGTRVDIQHLAATPEGMRVELIARITGIDRRAVTFEVIARDPIDEIGRCVHTRFVVDLARVREKLAEKSALGRETP